MPVRGLKKKWSREWSLSIFESYYLFCYLTFKDPHPGNLLVNEDGILCLLDFGLCAEVDPKSRAAMTKAIVHLISRDFDALVA
jgi:predicted unusual protein kinase regulating ubiquinone biosynthesis (AarF/ABC1/UbiB family)